MTMNNKNENAAKDWFKKGESDLNDAKILLQHAGNYGTICFLSQETIEKIFKGFLVLNGKRYRLIHNLGDLADDCSEIDAELLKFEDGYDRLTAYYIGPRYPLPYPKEHTEEEAKRRS